MKFFILYYFKQYIVVVYQIKGLFYTAKVFIIWVKVKISIFLLRVPGLVLVKGSNLNLINIKYLNAVFLLQRKEYMYSTYILHKM